MYFTRWNRRALIAIATVVIALIAVACGGGGGEQGFAGGGIPHDGGLIGLKADNATSIRAQAESDNRR